MKKITFFLILWVISAKLPAQESLPYKRTALTFNLTRMAVSEVNFGIEKFFSQRTSWELDGGIIYSNEFMSDFAESYTVDPLFIEHGIAIRLHYKMWRTKENSKWRMYLSPGIAVKHLYYKELEVSNLKTDSKGKSYNETLTQDRDRDKIGLEFNWGSVYEASRTFAFEIYYGAGFSVTATERKDYNKRITYIQPSDQIRNQSLPGVIDHSLYVRPYLTVGLKLVIRL